MRDGDPPWLSVDLRVLKANPKRAPVAAIAHPAADADNAYQHIRDVVAALNVAAREDDHPSAAPPTVTASQRRSRPSHRHSRAGAGTHRRARATRGAADPFRIANVQGVGAPRSSRSHQSGAGPWEDHGAPHAGARQPAQPPRPAPATPVPTVNGTCPLSGNPVKETALTHCKGESVGVGVGFCNPHRRDDFDTAIRIFDALIACG